MSIIAINTKGRSLNFIVEMDKDNIQLFTYPDTLVFPHEYDINEHTNQKEVMIRRSSILETVQKGASDITNYPLPGRISNDFNPSDIKQFTMGLIHSYSSIVRCNDDIEIKNLIDKLRSKVTVHHYIVSNNYIYGGVVAYDKDTPVSYTDKITFIMTESKYYDLSSAYMRNFNGNNDGTTMLSYSQKQYFVNGILHKKQNIKLELDYLKTNTFPIVKALSIVTLLFSLITIDYFYFTNGVITIGHCLFLFSILFMVAAFYIEKYTPSIPNSTLLVLFFVLPFATTMFYQENSDMNLSITEWTISFITKMICFNIVFMVIGVFANMHNYSQLKTSTFKYDINKYRKSVSKYFNLTLGFYSSH